MKHKNLVNLVLGLVIFVASLIWVRPVIGFGFFFGAGAGIAFVAAAQKLSNTANGYILTVIGLTSTLYAVLDIKSDILDRPELRSDAVMLAEHTGIPAVVWGGLWMIVSICLAFVFLVFASSRVVDPASTDTV
jgi:hypothetical protein